MPAGRETYIYRMWKDLALALQQWKLMALEAWWAASRMQAGTEVQAVQQS